MVRDFSFSFFWSYFWAPSLYRVHGNCQLWSFTLLEGIVTVKLQTLILTVMILTSKKAEFFWFLGGESCNSLL
jgi:hypothetical protein